MRTGGGKFLEDLDSIGGSNESGGCRLHRFIHQLLQQSFEGMANLPCRPLAARLGNRGERVREQIGPQQQLLPFESVLCLLKSVRDLAQDLKLLWFRIEEPASAPCCIALTSRRPSAALASWGAQACCSLRRKLAGSSCEGW